jgi:hypothetical protein
MFKVIASNVDWIKDDYPMGIGKGWSIFGPDKLYYSKKYNWPLEELDIKEVDEDEATSFTKTAGLALLGGAIAGGIGAIIAAGAGKKNIKIYSVISPDETKVILQTSNGGDIAHFQKHIPNKYL